jgi:hypothetical protein
MFDESSVVVPVTYTPTPGSSMVPVTRVSARLRGCLSKTTRFPTLRKMKRSSNEGGRPFGGDCGRVALVLSRLESSGASFR